MESFVLEATNLVKRFKSFVAVDNISFSIPQGKVVGLLGPNGAGKSTTIHMLIGITTPTEGSIRYFGKDFFSYRQTLLKRINYVSAYTHLQGRISVYENLLVFAALYQVRSPKKKIDELIEYFQAQSFLHQLYWDLSAGQKTRANLIRCLLNDPELILMDEPTASLDPDITDKTLSLIEELKESRKLSILFTSHKMDEVTRICDEVIFLNNGQIVAQDTPHNLTRQIQTAQLKITFDSTKQILSDLMKQLELSFTFLTHNQILITLDPAHIPKVIFKMGSENIWIQDIETIKPTLEDVFLQIARNTHHV